MPEKRKREVRLYQCDLCDYKTGWNWNLKLHKENKHGIGVTWHHCDLCDFKCKRNNRLKRHKANKHNIGVTWYECNICDFKCKEQGNLNKHKADKHGIGVRWHQCHLCDKKFKHNSNLKTHKAFKHDIGVTWHHCDQPNCDKKFKQKCTLKQHKVDIHHIGVTWHQCHLCDYKCKHKGSLKKHLKYVENVGNKTCQVCYKENLGVVKPYGSNGKYIDTCDDCAIKTGQKKRIEHRYANYLDKHYDFPSRKDVIVRGDACTRYRPDIIYEGPKRILHIEIDEHQHQKKGGDYSCDEKRISDLYDEFQTPVPDHYIVIRLNTDSYQTETKYYQVDRDKVFNKRAKILLKLMKKIEKNPPESKICIYYLYYSYDSNRIAKNIPYVMLNDENIRKYLK